FGGARLREAVQQSARGRCLRSLKGRGRPAGDPPVRGVVDLTASSGHRGGTAAPGSPQGSLKTEVPRNPGSAVRALPPPCQTKSMPGPRCHFDGEIINEPAVPGCQGVTREEVRRKPVENARQKWPSRQVIKTTCLSGCRISGLERWLSELP